MVELLRNRLRLVGREDGITLLIALGTLTVLTTVGATATYYASTNSRTASYSKAKEASFQLAEAGIHEALAVLGNQPTNDPTNPTLLSARTTTYSTGKATWSGTYNSTLGKWTITSTGRVTNPSSAAPSEATRTLTAVVPLTAVNTQPLAEDGWNYVYSWGTGDPSGCDMSMESAQAISARLMVTGNLCMSASAELVGSQARAVVGQQIKIDGSAKIGASGSPVERVDAGSGCRYELNPLHSPCTTADRVWATTATASPTLAPVPVLDLNGWYAKASPGPYAPCETVSGTPPVFDNDQGSTVDYSKRNRSVPGSFDLTAASSYTCRTTLGGQPRGELSWDSVQNLLTIRGTIFIDGNAKISRNARYTGQGTIYLSGSLLISGRMCAVALDNGKCDFTSGAWDVNTKLLAIVAAGTGGQGGVAADEAVVLATSANWQGALFGAAGTKVTVSSASNFAGPIIADEVNLNSSIEIGGFNWMVSSPTALPGNPTIYAEPGKPEYFAG
jgi:hypothetical protein